MDEKFWTALFGSAFTALSLLGGRWAAVWLKRQMAERDSERETKRYYQERIRELEKEIQRLTEERVKLVEEVAELREKCKSYAMQVNMLTNQWKRARAEVERGKKK